MLKKSILVVALLVAMGIDASAQTPTGSRKIAQVGYDFGQSEYKKCLNAVVSYTPKEYIACLNAEIARQNESMNGYYEALLRYPEFQKWNSGNGMFRGNLKDMNDQFMAYRERFCSLSGLALFQQFGNLDYGRKDCVMRVNDEMLRRLERMYNSSQVDFGPDVYNGETTN